MFKTEEMLSSIYDEFRLAFVQTTWLLLSALQFNWGDIKKPPGIDKEIMS